VYCELAGGTAEHTGVYLGNDLIAELTGDGVIRSVSSASFVGSSALRTGSHIYVACDLRTGEVIADSCVADAAESYLGQSTHYNVVLNNCHQFVAGCILGEMDNSVNFLLFLTRHIEERLNGHRSLDWRRLKRQV
jgi:hypothetical protein